MTKIILLKISKITALKFGKYLDIQYLTKDS